jgi:hypothetical protein
MPNVDDILTKMRNSPHGNRFSDVCKVCQHHFGKPRQTSGSHRIYKTPWQGDPRVNVQNDGGKAKPYQVRQVLRAVERLNDEN